MNSPEEYNTTPPDATKEDEVANKKVETSKVDDDGVENVAASSPANKKKPLSASTTELLKLYGGNDKATQSFYKNLDKKIEGQSQQQEKSKDGEDDEDGMPSTTGEGGEDVTLTFPQKLMEILTKEEHAEIISWLPHGRGFMIYKKKQFETDIMPIYFAKHSKYTSFTRKLNRWGFVRVTRGPEMGAYYHKFFKKGEERLCMQMSCQRPTGIGIEGTYSGVEDTSNSNNASAAAAANANANMAASSFGGMMNPSSAVAQMANMQSLNAAGVGGLFGGGGAGGLGGHDSASLLQLQQQQQHMQMLMRHREQMLQREAMLAARAGAGGLGAGGSTAAAMMYQQASLADMAAMKQQQQQQQHAALLAANQNQQQADLMYASGMMGGAGMNPNFGGLGGGGGFPPNMM